MAISENGLLDIWKVYRKDPESKDCKLIVSDMYRWEIYYMFVNTCVYQMISKKKWKRNYLNANLSTYVTIADEAFEILVLENYASDLVHNDDEARRYACDNQMQIIQIIKT